MPTVRKIRKIVRSDSAVSLRSLRALPSASSDHAESREITKPASPLEEKVWQVWIEGGDPVGPVSADQIARGIRAGKVPSDASVRREGDTFWSDLLDIPDMVAALKAVSAESEPPPPPLIAREFMVWIPGNDPVGPVSADQIARGIRAGKVPTDASLQRVGDFFASDVLDEPDVIAALKRL